MLAISVMFAFIARMETAAQSPASPSDLQVISFSAIQRYRQQLSIGISDPQGEAQAEPPRKKQPYQEYRVILKNTGTKVVRAVGWRYVIEFHDSAGNGESYRDLTSLLTIKPGENGKLKGVGGANMPGFTVEEGKVKRVVHPVAEKVIITRVEYADGSVWQAR